MGKKENNTRKRMLAMAMLAAILLSAFIMPMAAHAAASGTSSAGCDTKYPVVLVHGAGFRDKNLFQSYWGRIPKELEAQGAKLYYGGTDGWSGVEQGAATLKKNIDKILAQTGSKKVNIIAHSKGGIEARYMISSLQMAGKVASLTTISTPHRGSSAMDNYLAFPGWMRRVIASAANVIRWFWGDKKPDFYNGTESLGTEYMKAFNKNNPDKPGVYYQSYAGVMESPSGDFILGLPALGIGSAEGENDGMVSVASAKWTNFRGTLRPAGTNGVSHLDEVDFRRKDISIKMAQNGASNIREFYAALVSELKQKGY